MIVKKNDILASRVTFILPMRFFANKLLFFGLSYTSPCFITPVDFRIKKCFFTAPDCQAFWLPDCCWTAVRLSVGKVQNLWGTRARLCRFWITKKSLFYLKKNSLPPFFTSKKTPYPLFFFSRNEGHLHSWKLVNAIFVCIVSLQTSDSRLVLE